MSIRAIDSAPLSLNETQGLSAPSFDVGGTKGVSSFEDVFTGALDQANQADAVANQKVDALASGAIDDLHGTMISMKEADISIKLVGSVRNKILDAFQEIWRTSV